MTQTPDDKQKRQQNDNRNFYDVSFDYPEDERMPSSRSHSSSESVQQSHTDPELYQKYMKQSTTRSPKKKPDPTFVQHEEPHIRPEVDNEWQYEPRDKETVSEKSAKFFNQSVKKMKSLFSDLNANDTMKYNPYVDDLSERHEGALLNPALPKVSKRKKTTIEMEPTLSEATEREQHTDALSNPAPSIAQEDGQIGKGAPAERIPNHATPSKRTSSATYTAKTAPTYDVTSKTLRTHNGSTLPSPEEVRKERERRRRLRIEELATYETTDDVLRTHQDRFQPSLAETDSDPISTEKQTTDIAHTATQSVAEKTTSRDNEMDVSFATDDQTETPTETVGHVLAGAAVTVAAANALNMTQESNSVTHSHESDTPSQNEAERACDILQEPEPTVEATAETNTTDSNEADVSFTAIDEVETTTDTLGNVLAGAAVAAVAMGAINKDKDEDPIAQDVDVIAPLQDGEDVPTSTDINVTHSVDDTTEVESISTQEDSDADATNISTTQKQDPSKYSLKNFSWKERVIFGMNVGVNVLKRLVLYVVLIGLLLGSFGAGAGVGYFAHLVSQTPPPTREEMAAKINQLEQLSAIYYANGEKIANVQTDVVRSVTELGEVSPFIIDGLIATEDEHFYEHPGVVPKAILRATLQSIISLGAATGGSTLTQQLVKQRLLTNDVTFFRKANEILLALRLENFFSKDEILIAYLNVSPFGRNNSGENVAGIAKASEGIFGKKTNEVNLPQAAFLVGLPQNPYGYTPYDQHGNLREDHSEGIARMKEVLFRMYRTQKITKEAYDEALTYDITQDFLPTAPKSPERQSYLYQAMMQGAIEQLMRLNIQKDNLTWDQVYADDDWYNQYYFDAEQQLKTGGYKVYTTIDKQIYEQLQTSAKQYVGELGVAHEGIYVDPETGHEHTYIETVQNGLVIMDNASGKVLGFVSGTDYDANQIDHAFSVRRSPGSTIKPLAVYAPAIEENIITPATMIPDTAFVQTFEDGTTWTPTNYGSVVSGGNESARVALYKSDNLPAIRVYQELLNRHVDIVSYLEKMGFSTASSYSLDDVRNLSFSIGGVSKGPTVLEETRAFATFANGGQYIDGYYIERIEDSAGNIVFQHELKPVQVFSEDTNYLMVDMLRNTMSEGTARIARGYMEMGGDWIAKTGISENSKDVWMIASTPAVTIGSWIGYDSKYANLTINIEDGFGRESERSQLYWSRIVNDLYRIRPDIFGVDRVFEQPASVVKTPVLQATGTLPGTITLDNGSIPISGPVYEDVFKASYPAPALSYNFLFGATEDEQASFWANYRAQLEEQRRRQQQQQQSSASSSSSSTQGENSSSDESSQPNNEQTNTDTNNNNNGQ